jgi:hypothetical protein
MSIRTLNSPAKLSPAKIDNFNFKGRIFEINDDIIKEENEDSYQNPVDEYITPRVYKNLTLESQAPSNSELR